MWRELGFWGLFFGFLFSGVYAVYIGEQTLNWGGILVFAKVLLVLIIIAWAIYILKVAAMEDKSKEDRITFINQEINSVVPNIQLQEDISIRDVQMGDFLTAIFPVPVSLMVSVPFANNPEKPNAHNDAKKVRAEITFLDENRIPLFKPITGRWGGLQPPEIFGSDRKILESADFPNNGAVRWLDLLMKYPEDEYCYAYNNDSYGKKYFQHPEFQISKSRFFVQIALKGAYIPNDIWEFECMTLGIGHTFQIRKKGEAWKPEPQSGATKNLVPQTTKKKSSQKRTSSKR